MSIHNPESTPPETIDGLPVIRLEEAVLLDDIVTEYDYHAPGFFRDKTAKAGAQYMSLGSKEHMDKNFALKFYSPDEVHELFDNPDKGAFLKTSDHLGVLHALAIGKEEAIYTYIDDMPRFRKTNAETALSKINKTTLKSDDLGEHLKSGAFANNSNITKLIIKEKGVSADEIAAQVTRLRMGIEIIGADTTTQFGVNALRALMRQMPDRMPQSGKAKLTTYLNLIDQSKNTRNSRDKDVPRSPREYTELVDKRLSTVAATFDTLDADASYPDSLNDYILDAKQVLSGYRNLRMKGAIRPLLNGKAMLLSEPANPEIYARPNLSIFTPPREQITIPLRTPAEIAAEVERRHQDRATEQAAQKEAQAAEKQGLIEEETPYIEAINAIVDEHSTLLAPFRNQASRYLRSKGLVGPNSVDYSLRQSKLEAPLGFETYIRTYEGLSQFVESHDEYLEDFETLTGEEKRLREAYLEAVSARVFRSGLKPTELQTSLSEDTDWLRAHWNEFTSYIGRSEHRKHLNQETLSRVKSLLFKDQEVELVEEINAVEATEDPIIEEIIIDEISDDIVLVEEQPQEVVEWTAEELLELAEMEREERERAAVNHEEFVKANELIEQLDWVVLPDQLLTPEDLVNLAKRTLNEQGKTNLVVDHERMVNLLKFRDTYGGTLYRSAERTLGDSNNLYFVLKFTHPGDDNTYAIAENVVYGNATYVLREDILPLMDGETVLTAVKLPRRVVKDLGAKRLTHIQNGTKTHPERITDSLIDLSNTPSF